MIARRVLLIAATAVLGLAVLPAIWPPALLAQAADAPPERVLVVLVPGASFEQLMAIPDVRALARGGAVGLMSTRVASNDQGTGRYVTIGAGTRSAGPAEVTFEPAGAQYVLQDLAAVTSANDGTATPGLLGASLDRAGVRRCPLTLGSALLASMDTAGRVPAAGDSLVGCGVIVAQQPLEDLDIRGLVERIPGSDVVTVMVLSPEPSAAMDTARDELSPIVMASGPPELMFPSSGPTFAATSDTTHRRGVVSIEDLAPTILSRLGLPFPAEMEGTAIRGVVVGFDVEALHQRHLANRRMSVPVQAFSGAAVLFFFIAGLVICLRRGRVAPWVRGLGRWCCFAPPVVGVALLAAGHLPTLNYVTVGAFVGVFTLVVPVVALVFRGRGVLTPPLVLGVLILAYFLFEALTGWEGTLFTLHGGTALDGARFYGLPNADIGLLLGSAFFIAASLKPWPGFALVVVVALFVGFPAMGADLGGATAILAAAGIWLGLRVRGRFGWREAGFAAATIVAGLAVVLLAHRFLASTATHGTRFVEAEASDPLGIFSTEWSRLAIGVRLLQRSPLGLFYLVLTPVLLWLVMKPRGGMRKIFEDYPHWRSAMLTILWGSVVAYFVNDTGVAAVGMGFAMALAGVLYVPLAAEPAGIEAS